MVRILNPAVTQRLPGYVFMDLDNTLYPYDPNHQRALKAVRGKLTRNIGISDEQFEASFSEGRRQVKTALQGTASSHSRLLYFQRMLELMGLRTQPLMALDLEQTYWRVFLDGAELFPGVHDFLDELRLVGIPAALITNLTAQIQFRKLVHFGLDQHFESIVTSEEAGAEKPAEAPFRLALSKAGEIGGPLWMIGDDPQGDMRGARQHLGAFTFQKLHPGSGPESPEDRADVVFRDFNDLRRILARVPVRP